jgi:glycosyltransferase involved in cell wall biosynthesis
LKHKLFIIGCSGVPASYGGFETFAENLSLRLSFDFDIYVTCSTKAYICENRQKSWNNITRIFIPFKANGVQSLIYDFISFFIAHSKADFIIMLGSGSGLILLFFRIFKKLPVAVHIDGLEWKRKKWNWFARAFLWINYRFCLKFSQYIIADNKALIKNIPEKYLSKMVNISYGCEHIPEIKINPTFSKFPYALVIARAEPENNLEMIIDAFKLISNLNLIIISNWEYTKYGRRFFRNSNDFTNIKILRDRKSVV